MSTYVRYYPEIKVNGKWYWAVMHNPLSFVKDRNLTENKTQINITESNKCLLTDELGCLFKQFVESYGIEKIFNSYYTDNNQFVNRGLPENIDPKLLNYINSQNGTFNHTYVIIKELNELLQNHSKNLYIGCLKDSKDSQLSVLNDKIDLIFGIINEKLSGIDFDKLSFDKKLKKISTKSMDISLFDENFTDNLNYVNQLSQLINILDYIGQLTETVYKVEDKRYIITFE